MTVSPIPEGYHSLTPYLVCKGATAAIAFYKQAFNAEEVMRLDMPGGMIGHAELKIGNSHLMLADECEMVSAPPKPGDSGMGLCLYVENCDELFAQAIAAGGTEKRPMQDQFYGDRSGTLVDPFGHVWTVATHKEDLTQEEISERMAAFMQNMGDEQPE
ncbi:MAG: VOC family protein [Planctomycetota bacterium]|nr:VOC family protein [Planctomycetota bacterium]MDA0919825.1 VOC family protein [Planctomycetota bacterium]